MPAPRRRPPGADGAAGQTLEPRILLAGTIAFDFGILARDLHPTLRYFGSDDPAAAPFTQIGGGFGHSTGWTGFPELTAEFGTSADLRFDFEGGLELVSFDDGTATGRSRAIYGSPVGNSLAFRLFKESTEETFARGAIFEVTVDYSLEGGTPQFTLGRARVQIGAPVGTDPTVFRAITEATGNGTGTGLVELVFSHLDFRGTSAGVGDAELLFGSMRTDLTPAVPVDGVAARAANGRWWLARPGDRTFGAAAGPVYSRAIDWRDFKTLDLNSDGRDDFVGRNAANNRWVAAINDGSGNYRTELLADWVDNVEFVDTQFADLNGDGRVDILSRHAVTGAWVAALSTRLTTSQSVWNTRVWARWSPEVNWVDVQVGQFGGDFRPDLVARHLGNGNLFVMISDGSRGRTRKLGRWSANVEWVNVVSGDFNGDGRTDLAGRVRSSGTWWVGLTRGSATAPSQLVRDWGRWPANAVWSNVYSDDFDNDGFDDIIGQASGGAFLIARAETLNLPPGQRTPTSFHSDLLLRSSQATTNWELVRSDFDRDGRVDLVGFDPATARLFVAYNRTGSLANWVLAGRFSTATNWTDWTRTEISRTSSGTTASASTMSNSAVSPTAAPTTAAPTTAAPRTAGATLGRMATVNIIPADTAARAASEDFALTDALIADVDARRTLLDHPRLDDD